MKRSDLPIASPCNKDWDTMTAAGRKRFCSDCKKHVHDMSGMSQSEAGAFLREHAGEKVCVRYAHDSAGNLLFAPAALIATSSLMYAVRGIAAAAAVSAGVYAYQQHQATTDESSRGFTLGAVSIESQQTQPSPEPMMPPSAHYRIDNKPPELPPEEYKKLGEIAVPAHIEATQDVPNLENK